MNKKILALLIPIFLVSSCNFKQHEDLTKEELINADKDALAQAIADRDSLIALYNDIAFDVAQIKNLEQIISISNASGENPNSNKLKDDLQAIKTTLQQRQEKLQKLEQQLKSSKLSNSKLEKSIELLKAQISSQKNEIDSLSNALSIAKSQIQNLQTDNDSLSQTITTISNEKAVVEEIANNAINDVNELNKCFYAIGTKKELKANNIIESGFLKKTKILQGQFDTAFFSSADKRTLTTINLHSNKAKILTNHPKESYTIEDIDGQKVLNITDYQQFWNLSNYLVIQVD